MVSSGHSAANDPRQPAARTRGGDLIPRLAAVYHHEPDPPERLVRQATGFMRWVGAVGLFAISLMGRLALDGVADIGAFSMFIPAVALATLYCGRAPAFVGLILALLAIDYFYLPPFGFDLTWPGGYLAELIFFIVGGIEIYLVGLLAGGLRAQLSRRRRSDRALADNQHLLRQMQGRVLHHLHVTLGMLEGSQLSLRRNSGEGTAKVEDVLEQAITRIGSMAELHHRLSDPRSFEGPLDELLHDVLDRLFFDLHVAVQVRIARVQLTTDQMAAICFLVTEAASTSIRRAFRPGAGCIFMVELREREGVLQLTIRDDGPQLAPGEDLLAGGMMHALVQGLAGSVKTRSNAGGTTIDVEFPMELAGIDASLDVLRT